MKRKKPMTSRVSPERTITFHSDLLQAVVELSDRGVLVENARELVEADLVHLNGLLSMYPTPAFYACLEQRFLLNERMLHYIEQRLTELDREPDEFQPSLN